MSPATLLLWTFLVIVWAAVVVCLGIALRILYAWWQAERAFKAQCRDANTDWEHEGE